MIKAEIVANSISPQGDQLVTVLATFPRIILAEVNTHRMLSKNTSSSRAIPFNKMVKAILDNPFIPIAWQKHHSGMQGTEYIENNKNYIQAWLDSRNDAIKNAERLYTNGLTKQLCNRLLEPFMWTTMLITGSKEGWDNFFELRCPNYEFRYSDDTASKIFKSRKDCSEWYKDEFSTEDSPYNTDLEWLSINKGQAEIHMMDLAEKIYDAFNESTHKQLKPGEWHIPFESKIDYSKFMEGKMETQDMRGQIQRRNDFKVKVSTAMAARTSYTVVGDEKEVDYSKMIELHDRLISQNPPHSSPMEHCGLAMSDEEYNITYGAKAENSKGNGWCRNFKGFIPYRHLIENN